MRKANPTRLSDKSKRMAKFVIPLSKAGLTSADIENLTKINPKNYELYYCLFNKIRRLRIGIRYIRDLAYSVENFGFNSITSNANIVAMELRREEEEKLAKKLEEEKKVEKESNIKELWELIKQFEITPEEFIKGYRNIKK